MSLTLSCSSSHSVSLSRSLCRPHWAHPVIVHFRRQQRQRHGRCERMDCLCQSQSKDEVSVPKLTSSDGTKDPAKITEKYGLEAGLFSVFRNSDSQITAKDLLKRYGAAYLITSITLALITFTLCYVAVDAGVDVPALLARVGISVDADSAEEKAGTLALAYAAHKALSPVRFPPTVALTPLLAQRFGKQRRDEPETTQSE